MSQPTDYPLTDAHGRDFSVRDYKTYLKTVRKRSANMANHTDLETAVTKLPTDQ